MKVRVLKPGSLSAAQRAAWSAIQCADPRFESPFFRPEFTLAMAAVRSDVQVGVMEDGGEPVAFLPFQRSGRVGRPVGGPLSDYQGVIARAGARWDAAELIRACGLAAWRFDHLIAAQDEFAAYHRRIEPSPFLELKDGFDAYRSALAASNQRYLAATFRQARQLGREVGPVRVQVASADRAALALLLRWKSAQYVRSGDADLFAFPWARALLERLLETRGERFAGVLSLLFAGDHLVAAHMGLGAGGVLHWWFPAYDRAHAKYSPGRILLAEVAQQAPAHGIRRIDLGRGLDEYKQRAMSGAVDVASGAVDSRVLAPWLREQWYETRERITRSPLRGIARVPARLAHRVTRWLSFR